MKVETVDISPVLQLLLQRFSGLFLTGLRHQHVQWHSDWNQPVLDSTGTAGKGQNKLSLMSQGFAGKENLVNCIQYTKTSNGPTIEARNDVNRYIVRKSWLTILVEEMVYVDLIFCHFYKERVQRDAKRCRTQPSSPLAPPGFGALRIFASHQLWPLARPTYREET